MTTSLSHETHSQFIDQFFSSQFGIARNLQRGRRTVVISILFSSASGFSRILACWGRSVGNIYIPSLLLFVLCPQSSYISLYLYLYHTCLFLSLPSYFACFFSRIERAEGKGPRRGEKGKQGVVGCFFFGSVGRAAEVGFYPPFSSFLFGLSTGRRRRRGRWIYIYVHVYAVLCLRAHCVIFVFLITPAYSVCNYNPPPPKLPGNMI